MIIAPHTLACVHPGFPHIPGHGAVDMRPGRCAPTESGMHRTSNDDDGSGNCTLYLMRNIYVPQPS